LLTAAGSAVGPAPRLPGHPLLDRPGFRVYGSWDRGHVRCPRLLPLPPESVGARRTGRRAHMLSTSLIGSSSP